MVKKNYSFLTVIITIFLINLLSIQAVKGGSPGLNGVPDKVTTSDIRQIKKELPDFQRPDFKQIPYLIQRVNTESGTTDYLFPPEEPGQPEAHIAFTRPSIDTHSSLLVFQTGSYKWRPSVPRKYVVFRRHSKKIPVYFLAYAYVRQNDVDSLIEWEVEDLTRSPERSRIEQEICRGEECDLPEWTLGTCPIVSHKCHVQLDKEENETIAQRLKTEEAMMMDNDEDDHDDDRDDDDEEDEDDDESLEKINLNNSQRSSDSSQDEDDFYGLGQRRRRRNRRSVSHFKNSRNFRKKLSSSGVKPDVPSSLDLLFIKTPDEEEAQRKEEEVKNLKKIQTPLHKPSQKREKINGKIQKRTSRHNMEEVLHLLKCRDCQKSGNFFNDLEEEPTFNRIFGDKLQLQFQSMTTKHWRRFPWTRSRSSLSLSVPYIGYGDCAYMSLEPDLKKPVSKEMDDVIEFYLDTLRLDCNNNLKNEIRGWLTSKWRFVRIVQDLSFELITNSKLLTYSMLTPQQFETVMDAILFLKYSTVYREESSSSSSSQNVNGGQKSFRLQLLGHPLSSRTSFLTRVFLKIIDSVNQHLKHHIVKVARRLARILKDKFYALLQAKGVIHKGRSKKKKENLLKENYRDRIQVMALKEFVLYGLSPIFKSGAQTEDAFKSFYQLNENRIRFLVHSYGFDEDSNK